MRRELPGVSFSAVPAADPPSPLRTDVAGFVLRTRRGPLGVPVRVVGLREAEYHFGGLDRRFHGPYALRGYFENEGEVAHVVRVAAAGTPTASATWRAAADLEPGALAAVGALHDEYGVAATSPGVWARGLALDVSYLRWGPSGAPELTLVVRPAGEPEERLERVALDRLVDDVNARSRYVRLTPLGAAPGPITGSGPASLRWPRVTLEVADEPDEPLETVYDQAATALFEAPEVALLAAPDAYGDLQRDAFGWFARVLERSDQLLDRLCVVDAPPEALSAADDPLTPFRLLRQRLAPGGTKALRAAALYHPYLAVIDPLGGVVEPIRMVPPSGHVAGVISRLDRERGAHHTPANGRLAGAVALEGEPEREDAPRLYREAVNLLRCHPRDGFVIWGGRTLAFDPEDGGFLAHRRLVHRLVRAIRRVAEPLVFDTNGPLLWLAFVRGVTTVLLSAFQAGALKGNRPEQAFRVKCDEETNPPEEVELGRCSCTIEIAPAAPLEFIELRVTLSRDGALEVLTP
jgi:hypothetical protein